LITFFINAYLGAKVAQYAGANLHKFIVKQPEYAAGNIEEALRKVNYWLEINKSTINAA
jgi:hypothetical protein